MANKRLQQYIKKGTPNPITTNEEVAKNPDNKIDQDFPGFPHGHASEKIIHPETKADKKRQILIIKTEKKERSTKGKFHNCWHGV